jgi:hypothetical protein
MERMSTKEFRETMAKKKPSKYRNKITTICTHFRGRIQYIRFHSVKEAHRFIDLLTLSRNKEISELALQERFILVEASETEKPITYVADFVYLKNGRWVVEDVKGFKTQTYINKRKLFKKKFADMEFVEI